MILAHLEVSVKDIQSISMISLFRNFLGMIRVWKMRINQILTGLMNSIYKPLSLIQEEKDLRDTLETPTTFVKHPLEVIDRICSEAQQVCLLKVSCFMESYGCPERLDFDEILRHKDQCLFRKMALLPMRLLYNQSLGKFFVYSSLADMTERTPEHQHVWLNGYDTLLQASLFG